MNLKCIIYFTTILLFSCLEPTLISDKDCNGVIGGEAIVDECGVCDGPGKTGCDSTCGSTLQIDCTGICGGNSDLDCNGECDGGAHLDYYCKENEDGTLNLDSLSVECISENEIGNCRPNTNSCYYIDCISDTMYNNTVIDCNFNLPSIENGLCSEEGMCLNLNDPQFGYVGDGSCDYYGPQYNFTNCEEFNFDDGDCNLVDCYGFHFSDSLCVILFEQSLCITGENNWLGDGSCDNGTNEDLPLNFNCEKWGFDGAECICIDEENNAYDCWDKTVIGNYICPSEGEITGGDCLNSSSRVKFSRNNSYNDTSTKMSKIKKL